MRKLKVKPVLRGSCSLKERRVLLVSGLDWRHRAREVGVIDKWSPPSSVTTKVPFVGLFFPSVDPYNCWINTAVSTPPADLEFNKTDMRLLFSPFFFFFRFEIPIYYFHIISHFIIAHVLYWTLAQLSDKS